MNASEVLTAKNNYKNSTPHAILKLTGCKELAIYAASSPRTGLLCVKTLGIKHVECPITSNTYAEDGTVTTETLGTRSEFSLDHQTRSLNPKSILYVRPGKGDSAAVTEIVAAVESAIANS